VKSYWSPHIASLAPYSPGEQPQDQTGIKLNTNENPYPPSPRVADAIAGIDAEWLRRYPDPESTQLTDAVAKYHRLENNQVFIGNGSDEVLAHAFQTFFRQKLPILTPDISYSFYPVYCALYEIEHRPIELDSEFQINLDDYRTANGGIIIANPNAPTGIALSVERIRSLMESNSDSVVIIDEAYVDFGAESASSLIGEFPNILVVHTFSKSRSLAGARIGYALGQAALIEGLKRVKNSFNSYPIDRIAAMIGLAALSDQAYFDQCRARIVSTRENLSRQLNQLGFRVYPSASNFILVEPPDCATAESIYLALKMKGILVRYFKQPRIDNCLRITIGTDTECNALVEAIQTILDSSAENARQ